MTQELTLDQITPRMPLNRKLLLGGLGLTTALILITTYIWCGIDPFALYAKRENAVSYLFGRTVDESDRQSAMRQAERVPAIIAMEEAMQDVRTQMQAAGENDFTEMTRRAKALSEERLAAMPKAEHDAIVQDEYARIVDQKRGGFFPPETAMSNLRKYFRALVETVAIAIWGTLFAFVASIPLSMLAARNTLRLIIPGSSPSRKTVRRAIQFGVRRFLDFCRGFNEFVMALIFVAVIGLGPFAGVLALAIHTLGNLGKVISEAVEAIEPGQVEAVEASGSSPLQVMAFAVLPQVMPTIVSFSLLKFESNGRSATSLGFVGAGGIGFLMFDKLNGYLYREVCTMMIMVILTVVVIDYACGILRRKFI
ncbi:MAG: phosphonate ABC transporter, permease protein PhnE [Halodesulfovibrio sp.]